MIVTQTVIIKIITCDPWMWSRQGITNFVLFLSMHACLGLLNSILDTSKIEAGKMQLEEEEFELSHLLEDVVDFYHPLAMKKGVDLVLDPCNGSIIRYSRVKGDRGRLKQVLCNLLSNAVKFTDEGHIVVRAWAQKPSLHNSIVATKQHSLTKRLSCLCFKKSEEARDDIEAMNSIQQDLHSMDIIFEVDDTGKGIPKENYKSVFEDYVQVKETALGHGGTGLGLGIVQSLVRITCYSYYQLIENYMFTVPQGGSFFLALFFFFDRILVVIITYNFSCGLYSMFIVGILIIVYCLGFNFSVNKTKIC